MNQKDKYHNEYDINFIERFCDDEVTIEEREQFILHIADCAECHFRLNAILKMREELKSVEVTSEDKERYFKVKNEYEGKETSRHRPVQSGSSESVIETLLSRLKHAWVPVTAAAAAAAIVLFLIFRTGGGPGIVNYSCSAAWQTGDTKGFAESHPLLADVTPVKMMRAELTAGKDSLRLIWAPAIPAQQYSVRLMQEGTETELIFTTGIQDTSVVVALHGMERKKRIVWEVVGALDLDISYTGRAAFEVQ